MVNWTTFFATQLPYFTALVIGVVIPISLVIGRSSIRRRRLRLIDDLQDILVRHGSIGSMPPALSLLRGNYISYYQQKGFSLLRATWIAGIYIGPLFCYMALSLLGFGVLITFEQERIHTMNAGAFIPYSEASSDVRYLTSFTLVIGTSFLSAYLLSLYNIYKSVISENFCPLVFFKETVRIMTVTVVAWVGTEMMAILNAKEVSLLAGAILAFLCGLCPLFDVNLVAERLPLWFARRPWPLRAVESTRSMPLSLVDGISYSVRFRLIRLGIGDIQSLATADPVSVLIKTPYTLYQIIDWISQAQLISELGPKSWANAREHGVRDMVAFLSLGRGGEAGLHQLRSFLIVEGDSEDTLHVKFNSIASKLHVRHLDYWHRMLIETIEYLVVKNERIGSLRAVS